MVTDMKAKHMIIAAFAAMALTQTSCEKVSPQGVLMAGTGVEDRVKMSEAYYRDYLMDSKNDIYVRPNEYGEYTYSFLVGADSHITDDSGRMDEMFKIGLDNDDLLYCHLGDIADTKAEYYIRLDSLMQEAKARYVVKNYKLNDYGRWIHKYDPDDMADGYSYDEIKLPFFPVVGNHDLTHNGWALWSNIFHSSFYEFDVVCGTDQLGNTVRDHFIFLDTASGTLGAHQVDLIEQGLLDGEKNYRYTFIFSHTNIFLPQHFQFSSTFPREEAYFLLDQFEKWNASAIFCGHVHKWDDRFFNSVYYVTLDTMCERNNPQPGDYLVRINVRDSGGYEMERVHMNYTAPKK